MRYLVIGLVAVSLGACDRNDNNQGSGTSGNTAPERVNSGAGQGTGTGAGGMGTGGTQTQPGQTGVTPPGTGGSGGGSSTR